MTNTFYNEFDRTLLAPEPGDHRSEFQRNRDRLIHNAAFRRLQSKTQVFLSGEYDFYRTRLTHSIEVAQIASSICGYLNWQSSALHDTFHIDRDLVEAAALAHDIGHPPFGHAGEGTLNDLMRPFGGFEGNAQTLRLITETIFTSGLERRGLNPTRALIDAVLKYKSLHGELADPDNHFLYDDQARYLEFITGGRSFPAELTAGPPRNALRSLECEIMDWADDTAFSLNDVVDGVNAGFITGRRVRAWLAGSDLDEADRTAVEELLTAIEEGTVERLMNRTIGHFVKGCDLVERENFLSATTNRYRFGLVVDPLCRSRQKTFSRLAVDLVFRSPQICQLEHKGAAMLTRIFRTLQATYIDEDPANGKRGPERVLLSDDYEREIRKAGDHRNRRARIICDYIAGMTDGFATRIYKRLFDPDFGSIVDLI